MIEAVGCPGTVFNIPATSGLFAQMAGVLAGFAFAAIVLLLTPTQNTERQIAEKSSRADLSGANFSEEVEITRDNNKGILLALLTALLGFVLTTLTYSSLAGEPFPQARGRAATEELIGGLPFALAIMMLFHGLTLLVDNGHISKRAVGVSRAMAVLITPALGMFYLNSGASDTISARLAENAPRGACTETAPAPTLGLILSVILVITLSLAMTKGRQVGWLQKFGQAFQDVPPIGSVVVSVFAALFGSFVSTRSDDFLMAPWAMNSELVITGAVFALSGIILSTAGGREMLVKEQEGLSSGASTNERDATVEDPD